MKGLIIFCGGAVTGAAITLGVLTALSKKRGKDYVPDEHSYDGWEEVDVDLSKEPETDKEKKEVNKDIQEQAAAYNEKIKEYAAEHREKPIRVLEPWIMEDDEWNESPYEKAYYTYYALDDVLVDDNMQIVADGRCGTEFVDICKADNIVHVCNEELETNFEICYYDESTYAEDSANYDDLYGE